MFYQAAFYGVVNLVLTFIGLKLASIKFAFNFLSSYELSVLLDWRPLSIIYANLYASSYFKVAAVA
jgi:hypothetical protein